jgi:hypothetical protein
MCLYLQMTGAKIWDHLSALFAEKRWQRALIFLFPQGWTYREADRLVREAEEQAKDREGL